MFAHAHFFDLGDLKNVLRLKDKLQTREKRRKLKLYFEIKFPNLFITI